MPADNYTPPPDDPIAGSPILFRPSTFARHEKAVQSVEGANNSLYPRSPRGRTTHPAPGAWGLLAAGSSISAASGLTLGSGSVKLCDRTGTVPTPDETVTVYNGGSAISGGGSGKLLPLEWTAGDWTVCECGVIVAHDCGSLFSPDPSGYSFTLTDSNATITLGWTGIPYIYSGSYLLSKTGVNSITCPSYTKGSINLQVGYTLRCIDDFGAGTFTIGVGRGWWAANTSDPHLMGLTSTSGCPPVGPTYDYIDVSTIGNNCCAGTGDSNPFLEALGHSAVPSLNPFAWSGALTGPSTNTPDPAPGTVTVTRTPP